MTIGTHLASLNLFREADGSLHITVAGGSDAVYDEMNRNRVPGMAADYINSLIRKAVQGDPIRARGYDGAGWYIMERFEGARCLRHWTRYNLKAAALCEAQRMFPGEDTFAMWYDGKQWTDRT